LVDDAMIGVVSSADLMSWFCGAKVYWK